MMRKASKADTVKKAIQYWLNKNHTHEVDYDAVREFIKEENILHIPPITEDQQLDALLREAVRTDTWKTSRGRRVRKYGVPRWIIDGEVVTLPPQDMRYAEPPIAKTILDANYENGVSGLKRVAIERDEYNDYNLFKKDVLPDYEWDLTAHVEEARATGEYNNAFNEAELDDDEE